MSICSIRTDVKKNRIEMLDFFRGVAMLLVVIHHAGIPYGEYILAFHMPFLFLLSGYTEGLLQKSSVSAVSYLKNRFCRLVIPYFMFEGANLLLWSFYLLLHGQWVDFPAAMISILTCINTEAYTGYFNRLWFLPCMFVSDILFFFIKKICGGRPARLMISAFVMFILSWCTCTFLPFRLPFTVDTAFMAVGFLILGYVCQRTIDWMIHSKHVFLDAIMVTASFFVLQVCITVGHSACLMYENQYGPYLWSIAAAISGCILFLVAVKWLYRLLSNLNIGKNLVLWYGYNSLATFPVHFFIKVIVLSHIQWRLTWEIPWYGLFLIMLLVNIPIVNFITRYMPFMLGKMPPMRSRKGREVC